jgi:hypothetical protein
MSCGICVSRVEDGFSFVNDLSVLKNQGGNRKRIVFVSSAFSS